MASLCPKNRAGEALMVMGLAATRLHAILLVYIMANRREWAIPILRAHPWDKILLATLTAGIRMLCDSPIYYEVLDAPQPFKKKYRALKTERNRSYLDDNNKVLKMFDRDEVFHPNVALMKVAGIKAEVKDLSTDGKYFMLQTMVITSPEELNSLVES